MKGARAQLEGMATSYDPNFEFNAPKFHDFTNPCQDDDADLFFDTCNHESLPTGASSVQHVTAQQEDDHVAACEEGSESQKQEGSGEPQQGSPEDPVAEHAPAEVVVETAVESTAEKENAPEQTRAASAPKSAAKGASAGGSKQNSKLTESIIALAGFKGKEAELTLMAGSTVATAAAGDDAPVSARTRVSVEGQRSSLGEGSWQSNAQKGAASSGGALRASVSGSAGLKSDEKKRAHKAGASTTPFKSFAKKPRTEESGDAGEKESKTPNFARFGGSRGRCVGVSSTPNRRSSSVPGTGRPSMTPRSARKTADAAASPSLLRPTSSSIARSTSRSTSASRLRPSAAPSPSRLTVPQSPKFATSSRSRKRVVEGEGSTSSVGRLSTGSLHSLSRQSMGSASARKLTVPKSPTLRSSSRSRQSSAIKTEDAQMREALEAVENLKKRRKLGEARLKNAIEPRAGGGTTSLSTKELTVPQSPKLSGRTRTRDLNSSTASEGELPFRERMSKIERSGCRGKTPVKSDNAPPKLTEPKTPNFSSFRRKDPKVKSLAEREQEALEEAKRNQFKARPVNRAALDSCGDWGVPKVSRKALTTAVAPKLSTSDRSGRSRDSSLDSLGSLSASSLGSVGSMSSFKARRVPETTYSRPSSTTAHQKKELTIPQSPKLRSASRLRSSSVSSSSSEEELSKSFKALEVPDFTRKFVPKQHAGKLTEPEPFSLTTDSRHARYEAQLKAKKEAEDKKATEERCFKANPVRSAADLVSVGVASVSKRALTEPAPFKLMSEAKHEHASAQWSARVEKELEEEQQKFSSFHARAVPKVVLDSSKVYTPSRSAKPLTEVRDVQLNVDRRSQKHQELSEKRAQRQARLEAERLAEEERRKAEVELEVRELRRNLVIKAKPIPNTVYTGRPSVVHSSKPLTEPVSPTFRTDMRLRSART